MIHALKNFIKEIVFPAKINPNPVLEAPNLKKLNNQTQNYNLTLFTPLTNLPKI